MAATICFCFGLGFRTKNCKKQIGVLRLFHQFSMREQVVKLTVKCSVVEKKFDRFFLELLSKPDKLLERFENRCGYV